MTNLEKYVKRQRHHFAYKGVYNQSYAFSRSHVRMWELDHKQGWMPRNWCFWTVALEKTPESPLECKEIKPVNPKENQPWIFVGKTHVEAEATLFWPPDEKSGLIGKDSDAGKYWRQKKRAAENEMVRQHHWLNGYESEQTLGDTGGQRNLACTVHGVTKSQRLNKWCWIKISVNSGFPGGSDGQESICNAGDLGSSPGWGKSPGEGNGYPLLFSCLENSMDRWAWQAAPYGIRKSQTWLSDFHRFTSINSWLLINRYKRVDVCQGDVCVCIYTFPTSRRGARSNDNLVPMSTFCAQILVSKHHPSKRRTRTSWRNDQF